MLTWTLSIPCARSLWMTCSVIPMLPMWIFIAGSEFLCSSSTLPPCLAMISAAWPMPSMSRAQASAYSDWNG